MENLKIWLSSNMHVVFFYKCIMYFIVGTYLDVDVHFEMMRGIAQKGLQWAMTSKVIDSYNICNNELYFIVLLLYYTFKRSVLSSTYVVFEIVFNLAVWLKFIRLLKSDLVWVVSLNESATCHNLTGFCKSLFFKMSLNVILCIVS